MFINLRGETYIKMKLGWSDELTEPVMILESGTYCSPETRDLFEDLDDVAEIVEVSDSADIYIRTHDSGYIILDSVKIIATNLEEFAMYPILDVYVLNSNCSDDILDRLAHLADLEGALENDEVIAAALGLDYVKLHVRTRPDW